MYSSFRFHLMAVLCLIAFTAIGQTYYKKIRYESGHFSQELPTGYYVFIVGSIDPNVKEVKFTVADDSASVQYSWIRTTVDQKQFEVLIQPLRKSNRYTFSYKEEFRDSSLKFVNRDKSMEKILTDDEPNSSQLGLVTGIGVGFLGDRMNMSADMFGFTALKFNVRKIDKSRKFIGHEDKLIYDKTNEVYDKPFSRFSVLVGGATTKMGYKGKEVFNPVYNMKPMVGLSFNFNPELSLDAGMIFFDYQNGDPSLHTEFDRKLSMGMFVSVSIDFDLFTRLTKAVKGEPYNELQKN